MKKAALVLASIFLFLLGSCSNEPKEICINRIFTAKINIQYNEAAFTADFTCDENGCSAVFLSPEEVKGLRISALGNEITYSFGELELKSSEADGQILPINAVYDAISALPLTCEEAEETYRLRGETKYGRYIMNVSKADFTPTFIEYEEKDLTVKFEKTT